MHSTRQRLRVSSRTSLGLPVAEATSSLRDAARRCHLPNNQIVKEPTRWMRPKPHQICLKFRSCDCDFTRNYGSQTPSHLRIEFQFTTRGRAKWERVFLPLSDFTVNSTDEKSLAFEQPGSLASREEATRNIAESSDSFVVFQYRETRIADKGAEEKEAKD